MHVDWLSFTLKEYQEPRTAMQLYKFADIQLRKVGEHVREVIFNKQGFDPCGGRAPYRVAIARNDAGARIYGSSHTETILFEISGRGCEALRSSENARIFLGSILDGITRLDVAIDIPSSVRPNQFCNSREHEKFRSISFIRSSTGETVYVGSPKSDRFCRVYRYNPPHPRAHLLRVEFVFRRKLARAAAESYCKTENEQDFIGSLGNTYGFNHEIWQPRTVTDERLRVPVQERKDSDTVAWLYRSVAPALRRLMDTGTFDIVEFLDYVYNATGEAQ